MNEGVNLMNRRIIAVLMVLTMILSISAFALEDESAERCAQVTPLIAVKGGHVGNVLTWNDGDYLYIKYKLFEECGWKLESTHVHIQNAEWDEVLDGCCEPDHGREVYNYIKNHWDCRLSCYRIPMTDGCWGSCDQLMISAHAVLVKKVCETVVEAGEETHYSTTGGGVAVVDESGAWMSDAVEAYDPAGWDNHLVGPAFDSEAMWIWDRYNVEHPVDGDVVIFQKEFEMPGAELEGSLQAACDNGMAVYLNDEFLGAANLPLYNATLPYDLGDLTDPFVPSQGWQNVETFDLTGAMHQGTNVLKIIGVNEQMDRGTISTNPGGLKFQFETSWESIEECCCIRSAAWAYDKRCPKPSWATYYPYTVRPCCVE
jgi:hypothetical protein